MSNAAFDLFEEICSELRGKTESVLIDSDLSPSTLGSIKKSFQEPATTSAVEKAMDYLREHFENRGSLLPFTYDLATGRVTTVHREYIEFVSDAQDQRSKEKESKNFETGTAKCLVTRLTGTLRRVGWPRTKHKRPHELSFYLHSHFGFREDVLVGNDRDGGFDILWFPPLGAIPFPAIVSLQCKNSLYDRRDGLASVGRAEQSLHRHSYASSEGTHLHCVIYNDYIDKRLMEKSRDVGFVPLGISDLAPLHTVPSVECL